MAFYFHPKYIWNNWTKGKVFNFLSRVLNCSERKSASGISSYRTVFGLEKVYEKHSLFCKLLILCLCVSIFLSLSGQVHRKTLNPVFNETFKFSVSWAKFFHAFCPLMFMLYYYKHFSLVLHQH
jgi:hypothetical protein